MRLPRHLAAILAVFGFLLLACLASQPLAATGSATTLSVGLYPDVPRIQQFKSVIETEWAKAHPDVKIVWDDNWDGGYSDDPPDSLDVFVFDTLFLSYFNAQGYLYNFPKSQVTDFDDFLDYARKGVSSGDNVMGVPQLGCTTVLFYRSDDAEMGNATTLSDIKSVLETCTYYPETPPANVGLITDFSNESANAGYYIQSLQCAKNTWPVQLPWDQSEVDPSIIGYIRQVIAMSSFKNALYESDNEYQRGKWYGEGHGRAYIGYSESVTNIPEEQYANLSVKVMPWADNEGGIKAPLFYSDVIGINTATQGRGSTQLAIQLANLMASPDVLEQCLGPYNGEGPQYLIPARNSVFQNLAGTYPMYQKIYAMVESINPIMFDIGPQARRWFDAMQTQLTIDFKADPPCYTDVPAIGGFIANNEAAQNICPETCADYNGWSGQWTNIVSPSVCGCQTPR